MKKRITRRRFVAAAGIGTLASPALLALAQAPQIQTRSGSKSVVVAAANGNKSKDADGLTCVARAFKMIVEGADVLDAVIAGVNIVELDPEDTSVGYGGLPNADGAVPVDFSVMHGPPERAGALACIGGGRNAARVVPAGRLRNGRHSFLGPGGERR